MKRAVVLLSGGLDSATTLALCVREGFDAFALSFDYRQRHRIELQSARAVAQSLGAREHKVAQIDLRVFGGSALTDEIDVPKNTPNGHSERSGAESKNPVDDTFDTAPGSLDFARDDGRKIPITYVPARNTIFLSYALAWAEVLDARHIFIGVNAVDYSGYPDCRPEFLAAFETLASLATKAGVEGARFQIHAPLLQMSKAEIIRRATELGVDLSLTRSCYDPLKDGSACGECDSCRLRLKGFSEAGLTDPIRYVTK